MATTFTVQDLFKGSNYKVGSYEFVKKIGHGSHATVWLASTPEGKQVAIKQIPLNLSPDTAKRSYREIKLLKHFIKQDNIVSPIDFLVSDESTKEEFDEVFLVMDLCRTDLHKVLRSSQVLKKNHIKLFTFQLTSAIRALHSANVVHRDLKPQNILISTLPNFNFQILLCDFGTGRYVPPSPPAAGGCPLRRTCLTAVTSPFYLAPEGFLEKDLYSASVDVWALGCIVAEMMRKSPLFEARSSKHQLEMIAEIVGKPSHEELVDYPDSSKKTHLLNCSASPQGCIEERLPPDIENDAIDFIKKLLAFNPANRMTAAQAWEHSYLATLSGRKSFKEVERFEDIDEEERSQLEWKEALWEEVVFFNRRREELESTRTKEESLTVERDPPRSTILSTSAENSDCKDSQIVDQGAGKGHSEGLSPSGTCSSGQVGGEGGGLVTIDTSNSWVNVPTGEGGTPSKVVDGEDMWDL